jgi:transcriptional regulator with AAA-type ATPase domain
LVKTLEVAVTAAGPSQILFRKHLPENIRVHAAKTFVRKDLPSKSIPEKTADASTSLPSLKEFRKTAAAGAEREYLQELVTLIPNDVKKACHISGLSRSRFYELIKNYNISFPS